MMFAGVRYPTFTDPTLEYKQTGDTLIVWDGTDRSVPKRKFRVYIKSNKVIFYSLDHPKNQQQPSIAYTQMRGNPQVVFYKSNGIDDEDLIWLFNSIIRQRWNCVIHKSKF